MSETIKLWFYPLEGGGGEWGYFTKFYTGRLCPEVHPLNLLYTTLAKKVLLSNTFYWPMVALYKSSLELCICWIHCLAHIKAKLCKANKCLHVLRVCRKERYSQTEIDYLFYSIVFPNITYGLSVYGASVVEINVLQQFLDRCYKLCFISTQLNIRSLLQKQDKAIFQKAKQHDNHPLKGCLPQEKKNLTYNLRRKSFRRPKINTERYKNIFVHRLIFKYNLLWYFTSDMCNYFYEFFNLFILL